MKTFQFITAWGQPLIELLFPNVCSVCTKSLLPFEKVICSPCRVHLPYTNYVNHPHNKTAAIFWGRVNLVYCASFLHYKKGNSVRKLIHQLKYKGREDVGYFLGGQFGQHLKKIPLLHDLDGIVPVPLHPRKEKIRGYNQCKSIAEGLATQLNTPVLNHIVERKQFNTSQTTKDRYGRWENISDKFAVKNPGLAKNKHLLVVDDVITTGSTLEALMIELSSVTGIRISAVAIGSSY